MDNNEDVTEIKILHKARTEKKAKLIRERFQETDEELDDLQIRIRGYNRKSYTNL